MLLKFKGYGDKDVYINPTYIASVHTENYMQDGKIYTVVNISGRGKAYLIDEPIQNVVEAIEQATQPIILIPTEEK